MIVDTSALIAILRDEPDAESFALVLAADPSPQMSTANYLETAIVIDSSRDPIASRQVDHLVAKGNDFMHTDVAPVEVVSEGDSSAWGEDRSRE